MQWVEKVIKFFRFIFNNNQFKKRYRTKSIKKLNSIIKSDKWQIIDLRNSIEFKNNHLDKAINIPILSFEKRYWKTIDKRRNILLINSNYRSNLNAYQILKKHGIKAYVLATNYNIVATDPKFDQYISVYKII